jgi:integrase/recombinase XerD
MAKMKIKRSVEEENRLLVDIFEEFIFENEARNLAPKTIENYKQSVRLFMEFNGFNEETTTDDITAQLFYKWANTLKLNGAKHTTINHYLRDCRTFFYWCMKEERGYIEGFKIQLLEGQEEKPKLFEEDDLLLLLEKPKVKDDFTTWRNWAVVNWVLATGNRCSSIVEVKMKDVNFKTSEITLAHTKNKKTQILPITPALTTVLKDYIRIWRKKANSEEYLFCNCSEEKLTTNALRHSFAKFCNDRGVKQTNLHGLRHSFAKQFLLNDGNMFKLQKFLGHSTLDMTRRYVKLFSDDLKENYEAVSPLDNLKKASRRTKTIKRNT